MTTCHDKQAAALREPAGRHPLAGLAELSPAYFGMVMATGIVSIAAQLRGLPGIAQALFRFNLAVYAALWLLTALRIARHPRRFFADLTDHGRGPGFFTTVAGTAVLGSQFVVLAGDAGAARLLWAVALVLWIGLGYAVFAGLIVSRRKPALDRGISGAWLLAVVATQSIAVLGVLLAPRVDAADRPALDFLALSMWLFGGMLYVWLASLLFYRYTFFPLSPGDLSPPSWINMGAMAISTLAGSLLIVEAPHAPLLRALLPFVEGLTVLCWATGTWWIPLLLVLGVWRYIVRRFPLRYEPLYWGAVFPLGMYAVATHEMAEALGLAFLRAVPAVFLAVALAAWAAASAGLGFELLRRLGLFRGRASNAREHGAGVG